MRRCVLRDVAGDAVDGVHDVAREQGKCAEDRDRDDSEDDAVLGHRLPVFTSEPVVELLHRADLHGESVGGGPDPTFAVPDTSVAEEAAFIPRMRSFRLQTTKPATARAGS